MLNISVKRECQVLRGWFGQFDGSRSEIRTIATRAERNDDRLLLGIYMDPVSEAQVCQHHCFLGLVEDTNAAWAASDLPLV